jgi:hypothetical protein
MAQIFDIVGGEVVLTPEGLAIPVFKRLWDNDKSKDKKRALDEIKYVVFLVDPVKSPYKDIDEDIKENTIRTDIFKDSGWFPSQDVIDAVEKFTELKYTTTLKVLKAAKTAVEQLANYFSAVNFTEKDSWGKPLYSVNDLAANLGRVGNIVKSLNILEDAAKKELSEGSRIKGGTEIGYFEDPDNY